MNQTSFPRKALAYVLLVALVARILLLASQAVSFHADEAIVGLMARHILQGARPTFFYGQAYMGSLDAWLVAIGFSLLGESVQTIRIVQSILYMFVVATGFLVAWRLSERVVIAAVAGLTLAIPSVDVVLYSTATLGGYNEVMLLGNLSLLFGYDVTHEHRRSGWRWAALGACAGLGWWVNGLIVMYVLPVALLILYVVVLRNRLKSPPARSFSPSPCTGRELGGGVFKWSLRRSAETQHAVSPFLIAAVSFVLFSSPWWVFDFTHNHAALSTFLTNRQSGEFEGIGIPYVPPAERALGLAFIGLPTLLGLKFPWEASYFLLPVGAVVLVIYGIAIFRLLRGHNPLKPDARGLVLGIIGLFGVIFVASTFGADPTGRYFTVLALPFGTVLGTLAAAYNSWRRGNTERQQTPPFLPLSIGIERGLAFALVALILAYHAAGQIVAAASPTGITTQFDLISHIPNDHDDELMAFLDEQEVYHGYTNYWVAFRLAFLSGERMQFSAALPYKQDLSYNPADNRYPPYVDATEQAGRIAYITTNLPELDARLEAEWDEQGITYQETQIGAFHVYYGFEPEAPRPPPEFE